MEKFCDMFKKFWKVFDKISRYFEEALKKFRGKAWEIFLEENFEKFLNE